MENPSKVFAGAAQAAGSIDVLTRGPEEWRLSRAAHVSLLLMGMPRVNLLLVGIDHGVWTILEKHLLDLHEPITRWSPGQRLVLPSVACTGTLVLHDVAALSYDDQVRLLACLESANGRLQVISTTSVPLLPRVEAGAFIDTLYYRLNTVFVDVSS